MTLSCLGKWMLSSVLFSAAVLLSYCSPTHGAEQTEKGLEEPRNAVVQALDELTPEKLKVTDAAQRELMTKSAEGAREALNQSVEGLKKVLDPSATEKQAQTLGVYVALQHCFQELHKIANVVASNEEAHPILDKAFNGVEALRALATSQAEAALETTTFPLDPPAPDAGAGVVSNAAALELRDYLKEARDYARETRNMMDGLSFAPRVAPGSFGGLLVAPGNIGSLRIASGPVDKANLTKKVHIFLAADHNDSRSGLPGATASLRAFESLLRQESTLIINNVSDVRLGEVHTYHGEPGATASFSSANLLRDLGQLRSSDDEAVVVMYFGHGRSEPLGGQQFSHRLAFRGEDLDRNRIVEAAARTGAGLRIVITDACSNLPSLRAATSAVQAQVAPRTVRSVLKTLLFTKKGELNANGCTTSQLGVYDRDGGWYSKSLIRVLSSPAPANGVDWTTVQSQARQGLSDLWDRAPKTGGRLLVPDGTGRNFNVEKPVPQDFNTTLLSR